MAKYYIASGPTMGDCGHRHDTRDEAERCIGVTSDAILSIPGNDGLLQSASCDRVAYEVDAETGRRTNLVQRDIDAWYRGEAS